MAQNETSVSGDVVFQDGDDLSETNLTRTAAKSNLTDYVERGLGLNVDGAAGTVDIGSGHAIVQDGINAYDLFPNQQSGIALPGSGTNYIYVAIQPGSDDDVYYHIDEDQTPPTDPSILIGTADASAGTSAVLNRRPDQEIGDADIDQLVAALDANGQDINNVGSLSTDELNITDAYGQGDFLGGASWSANGQVTFSTSNQSYTNEVGWHFAFFTWDSVVPSGGNGAIYLFLNPEDTMDVRLRNTTDGETIYEETGASGTVESVESYTPTTTSATISLRWEIQSPDGSSVTARDPQTTIGVVLP